MCSDNQPSFHFLANNLALDFVNTAYGIGDNYCDCLSDNESVVTWLRRAGQLPDSCTTPPAGLVDKAKALRDNVKGIVLNAMVGKRFDTQLIDKILNQGFPERGLKWDEKDGGYSLVKHHENNNINSLLYPIAKALVELVCATHLEYVRQCEASDCSLLFLDTTKSHRRRWCSMALCGNRAKVAAYRDKLSARK